MRIRICNPPHSHFATAPSDSLSILSDLPTVISESEQPPTPGKWGAVSDMDIPVRETDVASETRVVICYTEHSSSRGHVLGSNDAE